MYGIVVGNGIGYVMRDGIVYVDCIRRYLRAGIVLWVKGVSDITSKGKGYEHYNCQYDCSCVFHYASVNIPDTNAIPMDVVNIVGLSFPDTNATPTIGVGVSTFPVVETATL